MAAYIASTVVRGRAINEPGYSRLIPLMPRPLVPSDSETPDLIGWDYSRGKREFYADPVAISEQNSPASVTRWTRLPNFDIGVTQPEKWFSNDSAFNNILPCRFWSCHR